MQKIEHKQTIEVKESPSVVIESGNVGYRVKGGESGQVLIEADIEFEPRRRDTEITIEDIISVETDDEAGQVEIKIDDPEVRQMRSRIVISVPENSTLEARADNGSIHVINATLKGRLESDNGSLILEDVIGDMQMITDNGSVKCAKVRGDISIESDNGTLKLAECEGGRFEAITDNGSIAGVRMNFNDINLRTDNGKIFYEFKPLEVGKASFVTDNGKIQMVIPDGVDYDIHATTDNGRFFIGLDGEYLIKNTPHGKEFQKTLGSGKVKIEAETQNGSIVMSNKMVQDARPGHDTISEGVHTGLKHALKVVSKVIGTIGGELGNVNIDLSPEDQEKVAQKVKKVSEKLQKASEKMQHKMEIDQEKLNGLDNLGEELDNLGAELKIKLSKMGKNISESVQKDLNDLQESPEWKTIVKRVKRVKGDEHEEHKEHKKEDQHQSRLQILQMLQEGKLSVDEAERLLKALDD